LACGIESRIVAAREYGSACTGKSGKTQKIVITPRDRREKAVIVNLSD